MQSSNPRPQAYNQNKITMSLFDAGLRCMTKCFLRSKGEEGAGSRYAEWVKGQEECYREEGVKSLKTGATHHDTVIVSPEIGNLKASKWLLAINLIVKEKNLESSLHAVERV